jgi:O-antigen/teichoic acid export membrane protein
LPATASAVVVNVILNLVLVPSHGIVGAGIALVASYVVVVILMYLFTERLFHVPYEWGRLALIVAVAAGLVGLGEGLVPTEGAGGFLVRLVLWLAFPVVLYLLRFLTAEERVQLRQLLAPAAVRERLRQLGREERAVEGDETPQAGAPETLEQAARDSDRGGTF